VAGALMSAKQYVGRFAPSPTGPLHFGSIIAALGSYLDARSNSGLWFVRIEDVDTVRVRAGSYDAILAGLEVLGLDWDGDVIYQSQRSNTYDSTLTKLQSTNLVYPCFCPRKLVKGRPYPGTCRDLPTIPQRQHALRIRTNSEPIAFEDIIQGKCSQCIEKETGDFIVFRSDGLHTYHLVSVIDDNRQGITHVVRGADLLDSTPPQIYLGKVLGLKAPCYCHLPVVVDSQGRKYSKQNHAEDILLKTDPVKILVNALRFLGQEPDDKLETGTVEDVLQSGIENWKMSKVPKRQTISIDRLLQQITKP